MVAQGVAPCSSALKTGITFAETLANAADVLESHRQSLIQAGTHPSAANSKCVGDDKVCKLAQMFALFRTQPTRLPQHWILASSAPGDKYTIW